MANFVPLILETNIEPSYNMGYASLEACLNDLEANGQLVRVKEEVDPYLEMAAIHLRVYEAKGPALLFENVKGSKFRAASNIFGTIERSKFIFRDTLASVQKLVVLKGDPIKAIKHPFDNFTTGRLTCQNNSSLMEHFKGSVLLIVHFNMVMEFSGLSL